MLQLEIVTPEKKIYSGPVHDVYLPGSEGEMGVLEMHAALVTSLVPGELRYTVDGKTEALAVGTGFAEVTQERVLVLTDMAAGEAEIDEAATEAAIERAQQQLDQLDHDHDLEEVAMLEAALAKSFAQLKLKGKYKGLQ
ncbi:ATP synthase F1 subunit epsilon [Verrucomicrobiaceae bacterium N1E253]|uniref:ATP synthase epsilon chain n=1 Tax=Oceaniferula marina TaxID=2748318 RepID=A0A851GDQ6_9BACT|nr:ATP synthase F1 subunit epsilon [Oceaniferula marina]NWK55683.1 ATP synthase F1 subunit epsilon [Oceaniferula marina]